MRRMAILLIEALGDSQICLVPALCATRIRRLVLALILYRLAALPLDRLKPGTRPARYSLLLEDTRAQVQTWRHLGWRQALGRDH